MSSDKFSIDGTQLAQRGYSNLQLLKSGGFSTVFTARQDTVGGRVVAVKILDRISDKDRERFAQEIELFARLSRHQHIVSIIDASATSDPPWLVMEYMAGGSAGELLQQAGRLSSADAAWIGSRVASGLAAAHIQGVLHRDIKPANILLGDGEAKLADFGIAKLADATQTTTGVTATLSYAAPEILEGKRGSDASDLYSLGATLFALLTGLAPHAHPDDETTRGPLVRRLTGVEPDWGLLSDVDDQMQSIVRSLLSFEPEDRPANANAVVERLTAQIGSEHRGGDLQEALTRSQPDLGKPERAATVLNDPPVDESTTATATSIAFFDESATARLASPAPEPVLQTRSRRGVAPLLIAATLAALVAGGVFAFVALRGPSDNDVAAGTEEQDPSPPTTNDDEIVDDLETPDDSNDLQSSENDSSDLDETTGEGNGTSDDIGNEQTVDGSGGDQGNGGAVDKTPISPDVVGLSESQAVAALESLGIAVSVSREHSETVDEGDVIAQSPPPNGKASAASLVVSLGPSDRDGDGRADTVDNCPDVENPEQADHNGNGLGDVCDDTDDDGIVDAADNCLTTVNPDQADQRGNGTGDVCDDPDGDAVVDSVDNCPDLSNPNQDDQEGDGIGDVCDTPVTDIIRVDLVSTSTGPHGCADGSTGGGNEIRHRSWTINGSRASMGDGFVLKVPSGSFPTIFGEIWDDDDNFLGGGDDLVAIFDFVPSNLGRFDQPASRNFEGCTSSLTYSVNLLAQEF